MAHSGTSRSEDDAAQFAAPNTDLIAPDSLHQIGSPPAGAAHFHKQQRAQNEFAIGRP